jgi:hypothetical protein
LTTSITVKELRIRRYFLIGFAASIITQLNLRNPFWNTEGPWEMLEHYNIAAVVTYSPEPDRLQFLPEPIVTGNHMFRAELYFVAGYILPVQHSQY